MKIKLVPQFENDPPSLQEQAEFRSIQQAVSKLGYCTLLLHYTDGTVLMRKLTAEQLGFWKKEEERLWAEKEGCTRT